MFVLRTEPLEIKPFRVVGSWDKQSMRLKKLFPQLTDADLIFESGRETELLFRIQNKLRIKLEEVITMIKRGMPEKD